jgi:hypothetical protein
VVDEIVQQAAEAASSLLVPEGLAADTWGKLTGIERFVLRMMDMETTGARKLDNYQNFAKAFRVQDYARVMGSMAPNEARLKRVTEFASRDLTDSTEMGATRLGRLVIALQQMLGHLSRRPSSASCRPRCPTSWKPARCWWTCWPSWNARRPRRMCARRPRCWARG